MTQAEQCYTPCALKLSEKTVQISCPGRKKCLSNYVIVSIFVEVASSECVSLIITHMAITVSDSYVCVWILLIFIIVIICPHFIGKILLFVG